MSSRSRRSVPDTAKRFRFRKNDTIGNLAAESDSAFLNNCFVDNEGDLDHIRDCSDERSIIIGRTGSGKTALLQMLLRREQHAISLDPHNLALGYISNSAVLTFFESLNIKMDIFYRALWRHVFVVEILKEYFNFATEQDKAHPWDVLRYTVLRKRAHLDGLDYLRTRGTEFWNTTEELIKEITVTAETELKAAVDVGLHQFIALGAEGANRLTREQRQVLHQLGQDVVNRIQMEKLAALFNALDEEILVNGQKHFFLVVDKLDEDWVDDPARYRLIRALIETMREFNSKVRFAKVVIALRTDLFNRVLNATTDSGFQGEKYKALCLPMRWSRRALLDVLDRRINQLVVSRYAGRQRTGYRDILPQTIGEAKELAADYILDRTLLRPRDAIAFLNRCLEQAEGECTVLPRHLIEAEHRYSCERLKSLADEWSIQYPHLEMLSKLLMGRTAHFKLGEISADSLADLSVGIVDVTNPVPGDDYRSLHRYIEGKKDSTALRREIAMIFYEVGLVGLKTTPHLSVQWSLDTTDYVAPADISDNATVAIHTMLWYALGIKPG